MKSQTILGIAFNKEYLTIIQMQLNNGKTKITKNICQNMALQPMNDDPILVGKEIQKILTDAKIHTKHCTIALPPELALHMHLQLPTKQKQEQQQYISLQIEKEFEYPPEALAIHTNIHNTTNNTQAYIVAVPKTYLEQLNQICKIAHLKLEQITLANSAIPVPSSKQIQINLIASQEQISLLITHTNKPYLCRHLVTVSKQTTIPYNTLISQLRISIAQLPEQFKQSITTINLFASTKLAQKIKTNLKSKLEKLNLTITISHHYQQLPNLEHIATFQAYSIAQTYLQNNKNTIHFIPEKKEKFAFLKKYKKSHLALRLTIVATAIILIIIANTIYQTIKLKQLEKRWANIKPKVETTQQLKEKVRTLRPWFSTKPTNIQIIHLITSTFPDYGDIWVTNIQIEQNKKITVNGKSHNYNAWQTMQEKLQTNPSVSKLELAQLRQTNATKDLNFSFSFQWQQGATNAK